MPKQTRYTVEFLAPIVASSNSLANVIKTIGLKPTGGNYTHIRQVIQKLGLDTSHFMGQGWNKGGECRNKVALETYLRNSKPIGSSRLRQRIIKEGLKDERCEICGLKVWRKKAIKFELHHRDGNHFNNNLKNLQILCPNCHSQQE